MQKYIIPLLLFFGIVPANGQNTVSNYTTYIATGIYKNTAVVILRKFERAGQNYFLTADLNTLDTQIIPSKGINEQACTWEDLNRKYKNTPYIKALNFANTQSFSMQDAGIVHGYPKQKGITLTIDLCPSHKSLDRIIFTSLITEFSNIEKPVPVALSISGRFMLNHSDDIDWLKLLEDKGDIDITWINHTYNHYYEPGVPLQDNFLLKPGTDINFEILQTEIAMIEKGLLPSVFFRFPGLVSNNAIVNKITGYGLIPIGSDAWLAKGQQSAGGSIVLIHGNGNEPLGVADFIKLLKSEKNTILQKQWLLYDLRESIDDEFKD